MGTNNYIIYKLTFSNNKVYIGQTKNYEKRMSDYKNLNNSVSKLIKFAIRKYGWNNIKKEILFTTSEEFVDELEIKMIAEHNATDRKFGYNLESGGNKNKIISEKSKQKMRESKLGKKHSEKSKRKMKKNHADFSKENHPMWGKKQSEKHKQNRILSLQKSINVYDMLGNFIKTFDSVKRAGIELNVNRSNISSVLKNRYKFAGGYIFKYN